MSHNKFRPKWRLLLLLLLFIKSEGVRIKINLPLLQLGSFDSYFFLLFLFFFWGGGGWVKNMTDFPNKLLKLDCCVTCVLLYVQEYSFESFGLL